VPASAKPKKVRRTPDASATIRKGVRDRLAAEFKSFLEDATEEEKWFLADVFTTRLSRFYTDEPHVAIAGAFENCIHRRGEYLCFKDEELSRAVHQFIRNYKQCEADGKFETAADGWRLWKASPRVN
jgi:hypothetical protein